MFRLILKPEREMHGGGNGISNQPNEREKEMYS